MTSWPAQSFYSKQRPQAIAPPVVAQAQACVDVTSASCLFEYLDLGVICRLLSTSLCCLTAVAVSVPTSFSVLAVLVPVLLRCVLRSVGPDDPASKRPDQGFLPVLRWY